MFLGDVRESRLSRWDQWLCLALVSWRRVELWELNTAPTVRA